MTQVVMPNSLDQVIADLSRRVDNLETGGKPMVGLSTVAEGSFSLNAGVRTAFTSSLTWASANEEENPGGLLYFSIYLDNDLDADYLWPNGTNWDHDVHPLLYRYDWGDLQNNDNQNRVMFSIENKDASSHTYYFHSQWTFIKGGSASS